FLVRRRQVRLRATHRFPCTFRCGAGQSGNGGTRNCTRQDEKRLLSESKTVSISSGVSGWTLTCPLTGHLFVLRLTLRSLYDFCGFLPDLFHRRLRSKRAFVSLRRFSSPPARRAPPFRPLRRRPRFFAPRRFRLTGVSIQPSDHYVFLAWFGGAGYLVTSLSGLGF